MSSLLTTESLAHPRFDDELNDGRSNKADGNRDEQAHPPGEEVEVEH